MRPILAVAFLLPACASDTDLEDAFCDLLANGPEEVMMAGGTVDEAPDVAVEDIRVSLELRDGPSHSGIARFTADEAGSFAFGLSDDVSFTVMDLYGDIIPFDAEVAGGCDALAVRYTVTLELDEYLLLFGPTTVPVIDIVSEESDDDL